MIQRYLTNSSFCAIILFGIIILNNCNSSTLETYLYERQSGSNIQKFSVQRERKKNNYEEHIYSYALDSQYNSTSQTFRDTIRLIIQKDTLFYRYYKVPINNSSIGNCHEYELLADYPLPNYRSCYIRETKDTLINGFLLKTCKIYTIQTLVTDGETFKVFFDWDKKIIVKEESKFVSVNLRKIL